VGKDRQSPNTPIGDMCDFGFRHEKLTRDERRALAS